MQTAKKLIIKAEEDGSDLQLALLNFRNTPITGENFSPAQLLMGRSLKTRLPATTAALKPKTIDYKQVKEARIQSQNKMKEYYDSKGARALSPLQVEDNARFRLRDKHQWIQAKVHEKTTNDRSYWVKTQSGRIYRRNRVDILKPKIMTQNCRPSFNKVMIGSSYSCDDILNTPSSPSTGRSSAYVPVTLAQGTANAARPHQHTGVHASAPPSLSPSPRGYYVTRSGRQVIPPERFACKFD